MSAIRLGEDLIHYEVLGRGRPVVLLHSWVGSWRYWVPTMQQLQLKYRVYALDFYGYGDSVKNPKKYSLEHQVQMLYDFTDQLGIPKTALVGHGLGAMVVTEFARRYSERVPRLLLVGAPLFDPGNLEQRAALMPKALAAKQAAHSTLDDERTVASASSAMRALLAEASRKNATAETGRPLPEAVLESNGVNPLQSVVAASTPEGLLAKCFRRSEPEFEKLQVDVGKADSNAMRHSVSNFDSGRMLDTLRYFLPMPIVIVHGKEDPIIKEPGEQVWQYLTAEKEDTLLPVLLSGVRHFPMLEYERFFRLVTDFLDAPEVSKLEIKERWKRRTR